MCFFFIILFFILKKNLFIKNNKTYYLLLIYFIFQIPGLIITNNSIENISFVVSALTIIATIILINEYFSYNEKKLFLILSFLILLTIFFLSFIPQIKQFFLGIRNMYGSLFENSEMFLYKSSPRSSGLSRTSLLLILLVFIFEKFFFKNKNIFLTIFKIFLLIAILLYQSRSIIFLTFLSFSLIFIFENKFSLKYLFKFLITYLLIPVIFTYLLFINYENKSYELRMDKWKEKNPTLLSENNIKLSEIAGDKPIRQFKIESISSGRFEDWFLIFDNFPKEKYFFGFGAQGDRYLIDQSASNGFIYAFVSSGIFGLIIYSIFIYIIFLKSIKMVLNFKNINIDSIYISLIIIILILRSFIETSVAVFSLDLIILLSCLIMINNDYKIKNLK
ncbi:MAG: hypothetical protein CMI90_03300 [Pelagibacteraceae bacterium]|nr:hypothetical protein [Pelagibacteraceae bacterium]